MIDRQEIQTEEQSKQIDFIKKKTDNIIHFNKIFTNNISIISANIKSKNTELSKINEDIKKKTENLQSLKTSIETI